MAETFFKVRILNATPIQEDILSSMVFDYGSTGLSEALHFTQPDLTYEPKILDSRKHILDVFFPTKPPEDFFHALLDLDSKLKWEVTQEETRDWLEEWKKSFKPFQLTGPYWIIPSWEEVPAACKRPIWIDPGMAFGTGTHATTQMAAYFVNKISQEIGNLKFECDFLDVGTGTGLLSMIAAQEEFRTVTAVEIDAEARRVARENFQKNGTTDIQLMDSPLEELGGTYHIIVANIIDGVLIQIKSDLLKRLKRIPNQKTHLFLTGILVEREEDFFKNFINESELKVNRRIEKEEWVGFWLTT